MADEARNALMGFLAGILSGMGIGGGSLLIIVLVSFFSVGQFKAQGINLLYFIPTAATALVIHAKNKRLCYKTAFFAGVPGMLAAAAAGFVAVNLDASIVKKAFSLLVLITGVFELIKKDKGEK